MLVLVLLAIGADPTPRFEVTNKVAPRFEVVNRTPAQPLFTPATGYDPPPVAVAPYYAPPVYRGTVCVGGTCYPVDAAGATPWMPLGGYYYPPPVSRWRR